MWIDLPGDKGNLRDPMDFDLRALVAAGPGGIYAGGGGRPPWGNLPWKDAKDWTGRDYDRFSDVLNECYARMMAKGGGGHGAYPNLQRPHMGGTPADATVNMLMTMMPPPGAHMNAMGPDEDSCWWGGGRPSRRRRRERPSSYPVDYGRMEESLREFKHQAQEFKQFMDGFNELVFGSELDQRREAFQRSLWKNLQGLIPQLGQMLAMQQQGGMGAGFGGPMPPGMVPPPLGGQMPVPLGFNPAMPPQGMGAFPGMTGVVPPMGGMAMPSAGAMGPFGMSPSAMGGGLGGFGGGGLVDPNMHPLFGGGGGLGGGGLPEIQPPIGFGSKRRPGLLGGSRGGRRDRGRDFWDDDLGGGWGGRRGRNRRGGRWEDEDDMLGGGGDDGRHSSRSPLGPRRPQPRPDGGGGSDRGNGGALFDVNDPAFPPSHLKPEPLRDSKPPDRHTLRDDFPIPTNTLSQHDRRQETSPRPQPSVPPRTFRSPGHAYPPIPSPGPPAMTAEERKIRASPVPPTMPTSSTAQPAENPYPFYVIDTFPPPSDFAHGRLDPVTTTSNAAGGTAPETPYDAWQEGIRSFEQWPGYRLGNIRSGTFGDRPSKLTPFTGEDMHSQQVRFDVPASEGNEMGKNRMDKGVGSGKGKGRAM